jgi:hypothetical protein
LFFDGVSSLTNSGVYRTDAQLRQDGANPTVIPRTREGYNHAGDLSFDSDKGGSCYRSSATTRGGAETLAAKEQLA